MNNGRPVTPLQKKAVAVTGFVNRKALVASPAVSVDGRQGERDRVKTNNT